MKRTSKPNFQNWSKRRPSQLPAKANRVTLQLFDRERVLVNFPFEMYSRELKEILLSNGVIWDPEIKQWVGQKHRAAGLEPLITGKFGPGSFVPVPDLWCRTLEPFPEEVSVYEEGKLECYLHYSPVELEFSALLLPMFDKLYQFQRECVDFGIRLHGRLLIADEMGVGKTVQSLCLASIYKAEWPLLVICPSSLKYNWRDEAVRWLGIKRELVQVVREGKEEIKNYAQIVILSYDLAAKRVAQLQHFKVSITDEAHYLKSLDSQRVLALRPFLKRRRRTLLLTGTPALARPRDLFNLASITRPDLFRCFRDFGNRYCNPQRSNWGRGMEYNGSANEKQLHFILKNTLMIRRLKSEVLGQLPEKHRQRIMVETEASLVRELNKLLLGGGQSQLGSLIDRMIASEGRGGEGSSLHQNFSKAYALSGRAKLKACLQYLEQLIENDIKLIVFAHHSQVLDRIEQRFDELKVESMRIDGSVDPEQRNERVRKFQEQPRVRLAILSITAACTGLTLTASSTVVFVEMTFTPAQMLQAEDRAHRISQKSNVHCHYLLGQNTLDQIIFSKLQKKLSLVSTIVDGKKETLQAELKSKGEKGDVSQKGEVYVPKKNPSTLDQIFSTMQQKIIKVRRNSKPPQIQEEVKPASIVEPKQQSGLIAKWERRASVQQDQAVEIQQKAAPPETHGEQQPMTLDRGQFQTPKKEDTEEEDQFEFCLGVLRKGQSEARREKAFQLIDEMVD